MTSAPTTQDTLLNWHRRLGHVNIGSIKDMARNNRVTGLKFSNKNLPVAIDCTTCQLAKIKRKRIPKKSTRLQEKTDEVADVDTVGPLRESRTKKKGTYYSLEIEVFMKYIFSDLKVMLIHLSKIILLKWIVNME
jgi:hypothetical protein